MISYRSDILLHACTIGRDPEVGGSVGQAAARAAGSELRVAAANGGRAVHARRPGRQQSTTDACEATSGERSLGEGVTDRCQASYSHQDDIFAEP
jgi:hypothetical protein